MDTIVITTSSFGEYDAQVLQPCRDRGYRIVLNPYKRTVKQDEFLSLCEDAVGIIAGTESLTSEVMARLPLLRVISRCGTGIDNVDLAAARTRGIQVFNTPDAPTQAVAELTIGLLLALVRKIAFSDRIMRGGVWKKPMGNLLAGKKAGVFGFGRIGKRVSELLVAFGCEVAFYDPRVKESVAGCKRYDKEALLRWADIVTIHVSGSERVFDAQTLSLMKPGSFLVNVSRGGVVDESALYEALSQGHLAGAAIDVFVQEPYEGPFLKLENVVVSPHIGSYAVESRIAMERQAVENLIYGLSKNK
jgi:D-3-phosphoglycerate dehydrogenase